jgi:hypothetical protein
MVAGLADAGHSAAVRASIHVRRHGGSQLASAISGHWLVEGHADGPKLLVLL